MADRAGPGPPAAVAAAGHVATAGVAEEGPAPAKSAAPSTPVGRGSRPCSAPEWRRSRVLDGVGAVDSEADVAAAPAVAATVAAAVAAAALGEGLEGVPTIRALPPAASNGGGAGRETGGGGGGGAAAAAVAHPTGSVGVGGGFSAMLAGGRVMVGRTTGLPRPPQLRASSLTSLMGGAGHQSPGPAAAAAAAPAGAASRGHPPPPPALTASMAWPSPTAEQPPLPLPQQIPTGPYYHSHHTQEPLELCAVGTSVRGSVTQEATGRAPPASVAASQEASTRGATEEGNGAGSGSGVGGSTAAGTTGGSTAAGTTGGSASATATAEPRHVTGWASSPQAPPPRKPALPPEARASSAAAARAAAAAAAAIAAAAGAAVGNSSGAADVAATAHGAPAAMRRKPAPLRPASSNLPPRDHLQRVRRAASVDGSGGSSPVTAEDTASPAALPLPHRPRVSSAGAVEHAYTGAGAAPVAEDGSRATGRVRKKASGLSAASTNKTAGGGSAPTGGSAKAAVGRKSSGKAAAGAAAGGGKAAKQGKRGSSAAKTAAGAGARPQGPASAEMPASGGGAGAAPGAPLTAAAGAAATAAAAPAENGRIAAIGGAGGLLARRVAPDLSVIPEESGSATGSVVAPEPGSGQHTPQIVAPQGADGGKEATRRSRTAAAAAAAAVSASGGAGGLLSPAAAGAGGSPLSPGQVTEALAAAGGGRKEKARRGPPRELDPESFQLGRILGSGSFATVYTARQLDTGTKVVVKRLDRRPIGRAAQSEADNEVAVLTRAGYHPNLVEFRGWYCDPRDGVMCLVMGYCGGGTLAQLIKNPPASEGGRGPGGGGGEAAAGAFGTTITIGGGGGSAALDGGALEAGALAAAALQRASYFPEEVVMFWFVQLLLALHHLHGRKIMHRDLKPDNIFLAANRRVIKLGDLGVAKQLEGTFELAITCLGTPYYMSPECLASRPYTYASDIWSLGCVLYEMAARRTAFEALGLPQLMFKILRVAYDPLPPQFSRPFQQLVNSMLRADPDDRPTTQDLLSHPFVRRHLKRLMDISARKPTATTAPSDRPSVMPPKVKPSEARSAVKRLERAAGGAAKKRRGAAATAAAMDELGAGGCLRPFSTGGGGAAAAARLNSPRAFGAAAGAAGAAGAGAGGAAAAGAGAGGGVARAKSVLQWDSGARYEARRQQQVEMRFRAREFEQRITREQVRQHRRERDPAVRAREAELEALRQELLARRERKQAQVAEQEILEERLGDLRLASEDDLAAFRTRNRLGRTRMDPQSPGPGSPGPGGEEGGDGDGEFFDGDDDEVEIPEEYDFEYIDDGDDDGHYDDGDEQYGHIRGVGGAAVTVATAAAAAARGLDAGDRTAAAAAVGSSPVGDDANGSGEATERAEMAAAEGLAAAAGESAVLSDIGRELQDQAMLDSQAEEERQRASALLNGSAEWHLAMTSMAGRDLYSTTSSKTRHSGMNDTAATAAVAVTTPPTAAAAATLTATAEQPATTGPAASTPCIHTPESTEQQAQQAGVSAEAAATDVAEAAAEGEVRGEEPQSAAGRPAGGDDPDAAMDPSRNTAQLTAVAASVAAQQEGGSAGADAGGSGDNPGKAVDLAAISVGAISRPEVPATPVAAPASGEPNEVMSLPDEAMMYYMSTTMGSVAAAGGAGGSPWDSMAGGLAADGDVAEEAPGSGSSAVSACAGEAMAETLAPLPVEPMPSERSDDHEPPPALPGAAATAAPVLWGLPPKMGGRVRPRSILDVMASEPSSNAVGEDDDEDDEDEGDDGEGTGEEDSEVSEANSTEEDEDSEEEEDEEEDSEEEESELVTSDVDDDDELEEEEEELDEDDDEEEVEEDMEVVEELGPEAEGEEGEEGEEAKGSRSDGAVVGGHTTPHRGFSRGSAMAASGAMSGVQSALPRRSLGFILPDPGTSTATEDDGADDGTSRDGGAVSRGDSEGGTCGRGGGGSGGSHWPRLRESVRLQLEVAAARDPRVGSHPSRRRSASMRASLGSSAAMERRARQLQLQQRSRSARPGRHGPPPDQQMMARSFQDLEQQLRAVWDEKDEGAMRRVLDRIWSLTMLQQGGEAAADANADDDAAAEDGTVEDGGGGPAPAREQLETGTSGPTPAAAQPPPLPLAGSHGSSMRTATTTSSSLSFGAAVEGGISAAASLNPPGAAAVAAAPLSPPAEELEEGTSEVEDGGKDDHGDDTADGEGLEGGGASAPPVTYQDGDAAAVGKAEASPLRDSRLLQPVLDIPRLCPRGLHVARRFSSPPPSPPLPSGPLPAPLPPPLSLSPPGCAEYGSPDRLRRLCQGSHPQVGAAGAAATAVALARPFTEWSLPGEEADGVGGGGGAAAAATMSGGRRRLVPQDPLVAMSLIAAPGHRGLAPLRTARPSSGCSPVADSEEVSSSASPPRLPPQPPLLLPLQPPGTAGTPSPLVYGGGTRLNLAPLRPDVWPRSNSAGGLAASVSAPSALVLGLLQPAAAPPPQGLAAHLSAAATPAAELTASEARQASQPSAPTSWGRGSSPPRPPSQDGAALLLPPVNPSSLQFRRRQGLSRAGSGSSGGMLAVAVDVAAGFAGVEDAGASATSPGSAPSHGHGHGQATANGSVSTSVHGHQQGTLSPRHYPLVMPLPESYDQTLFNGVAPPPMPYATAPHLRSLSHRVFHVSPSHMTAGAGHVLGLGGGGGGAAGIGHGSQSGGLPASSNGCRRSSLTGICAGPPVMASAGPHGPMGQGSGCGGSIAGEVFDGESGPNSDPGFAAVRLTTGGRSGGSAPLLPPLQGMASPPGLLMPKSSAAAAAAAATAAAANAAAAAAAAAAGAGGAGHPSASPLVGGRRHPAPSSQPSSARVSRTPSYNAAASSSNAGGGGGGLSSAALSGGVGGDDGFGSGADGSDDPWYAADLDDALLTGSGPSYTHLDDRVATPPPVHAASCPPLPPLHPHPVQGQVLGPGPVGSGGGGGGVRPVSPAPAPPSGTRDGPAASVSAAPVPSADLGGLMADIRRWKVDRSRHRAGMAAARMSTVAVTAGGPGVQSAQQHQHPGRANIT